MTEIPTPEPKTRRKMTPDAEQPDLPKPIELVLEDCPVVLLKLAILGWRKGLDDAADVELTSVTMLLDFDVSKQTAALPYTDALEAVRTAQADVGAKATAKLRISREFAAARLTLRDQLLGVEITGNLEITGTPEVSMVGENQVKLRARFTGELAGPTAVNQLVRLVKRSVKATLSPSQQDLFA